MNKQKISRHSPRVVAVETRGPFESFAMFKLLDGRTLFFRSIPTVVNSGDVKRKALEEQRKAKKAAQDRVRRDKYNQRQSKAEAEATKYNKKNKHRYKKPDQVRFPRVPTSDSKIRKLVDEFRIQLASVPVGAPIPADLAAIVEAMNIDLLSDGPMPTLEWYKLGGLLLARELKK